MVSQKEASSQEAIVGLDIGGTRVKAVAINTSSQPFEILDQFEGPSDAKISAEAVRVSSGTAVRSVLSRGFKLRGIGVGCAGSVEPHTGVVRNSPNFAAWKNVPLGAWLTEDFKTKVTVDNDANCAVFAEFKAGAAMGAQNVVLLTLGTGVGGGLILNGQLFRGSTGTGAELGHFSIHADGIQCNCGNTGCFERYCSASALRERAGNYSAREIFSRVNEPYFKVIVDDFMKDFKIGLTSVANIFDPDYILIGGGVAKGVADYFPELETWLKEHAFPAVSAHVKLGIAKFGNQSGAIGAAFLCADALSAGK